MSRRHDELLLNIPRRKRRRLERGVNETAPLLAFHELAKMRGAADPAAGVARALAIEDDSPRCTLFQQTLVEGRVRLAVRHGILPGNLPSLDELRARQAEAILEALGFDSQETHRDWVA